jgi:hypothetical protein
VTQTTQMTQNFTLQPIKALIYAENSEGINNSINKLKYGNLILEKSDEIVQAFEEKYKEVFKRKNINIKDYKFKIQSNIFQEEKNNLNSEITINEVFSVIKNMKNSAPGPNGLTLGFYKKFFLKFGKLYVDTINSCVSLSDTFNESVIRLKPKNQTDVKCLGDYRPISLTNFDYRIYGLVIKNRVMGICDKILMENQKCVGKNKRMNDTLHLIRDMIRDANTRKASHIITAIDQEKAFDNLSHEYIEALLNHLNIGENITCAMLKMYRQPWTQIIVNDKLTNKIDMYSGIRQGCPLSMLIYAFAIEEVLIGIEANDNIKGYPISGNKNKTIKSRGFADDINTFIRDKDSVIFIIQEFDEWGKVSGAKINVDKFKTLHLNCHIGDV